MSIPPPFGVELKTNHYDSTGPGLQLVGAWVFKFPSEEGRYYRNFFKGIFPYCVRLQSHGRVCW